MNANEARKYLLDISYALGNMSIEYLTEKDGDKMREAIKALEQEPCEDAVSRQAAIDIIEREEFKGDAISEIEKLSPVNPQPKTGRWQKIEPYPMMEHEYRCSECYHETDDPFENYCSECGTRMR